MSAPKLPDATREEPSEEDALSHLAAHNLAEKVLLTVDVDFLHVDELDLHSALLALEIAAAVWRRELASHGANDKYFEEVRRVAAICAEAHEVDVEEYDEDDEENFNPDDLGPVEPGRLDN